MSQDLPVLFHSHIYMRLHSIILCHQQTVFAHCLPPISFNEYLEYRMSLWAPSAEHQNEFLNCGSLLTSDELRQYLNYKAKECYRRFKREVQEWCELDTKEVYKLGKVTWTFKFFTLEKIQEHFRSLTD